MHNCHHIGTTLVYIKVSLYDEVAFKEELEVALNKKVDVVTIGSHMHDYFRQQLEKDLIKLW